MSIARESSGRMTFWANAKLAAAVGTVLAVGARGADAQRAAAEEPAPVPAALGAAPANTWVKVAEDKTGGRNSPMFFYDPEMKKFVLAGGVPAGTWGEAKRHFEVEFFDLATGRWINAYPANAPWKNESGVTDAPASGDIDKPLPLRGTGAAIRLGMHNSAYGPDTRAHFQWAYDANARKLFAYIMNKTLRYDPVARVWSDTGAAPFSKGGWPMAWGNMCYDPVNGEVLSIGGSSAEKGGTPGTYVFKISENAWRKIDPGSKELGELYGKAKALRRQGWALLSACRGRFYVAESETEAKGKLSEKGAALDAAVSKFSAELGGAKLAGAEAEAAKRAAGRLAEAQARLKAVSGRLDGAMSAEFIAEAKPVFDSLEAAELCLAPEPTGRAHSQPAFDAKNGRIVLFGGNGLDRCYADTWLYDPKTRSWEQKWPKLSPSPRGGHALVYLPKSGKIVLAGGYTIAGWIKDVPHEVWTYDVAANEWRLHLSVPVARGGSPGCPRGNLGGNYAHGGSPWSGAATVDDVLVMVDNGDLGRNTWACKVDPSKADEAQAAKFGVAPGTMSFPRSPADYEKDANPDAVKVAEFYKALKPNVWTPLKAPLSAGVAQRDFSYTACDPDRQQLLYWGGGHVAYMGTEVSHYSIRANRWTIGCPPDLPFEPAGGFHVKASLTFQDRPQIPIHAYYAYAYDPPSGRMFYLDRPYNVAERQWEPPYPGLEAAGPMNTRLEPTPQGVVAVSGKGLFRFEWKEKAWKKLPLKGPGFNEAYCETSSVCYDSKRDSLWHGTKEAIFRYDFKTGASEKLAVQVPKWYGGALTLMNAYVPEADLILIRKQVKGPGGKPTHIVFDPEARKYFAIDLEWSGPKSWLDGCTGGLTYDPKCGVILNHDCRGGIWALKLDRKSAKLTEMTEFWPLVE